MLNQRNHGFRAGNGRGWRPYVSSPCAAVRRSTAAACRGPQRGQDQLCSRAAEGCRAGRPALLPLLREPAVLQPCFWLGSKGGRKRPVPWSVVDGAAGALISSKLLRRLIERRRPKHCFQHWVTGAHRERVFVELSVKEIS